MAAASDQTYRSQKALDYVFAASCVLMLIGTVWMFVQDFFREYKSVGREFRNVEEAIAQRAVLDYAPTPEKLAAVIEAERAMVRARFMLDTVKERNERELGSVLALQAKATNDYQSIKADYDSLVSLYDIDVEERNAAALPAKQAALTTKVQSMKTEVDKLKEKLTAAQLKLDDANRKYAELMAKPLTADEVEKHSKEIASVAKAQAEETRRQELADSIKKELTGLNQLKAEEKYSSAEDSVKKLTVDFDRFGRLAEQKRWGFGDTFRTWPIVDAFNSPTKIQQYTLTELPIDYSFKYVTRYDRCTTCHLGIEKAAFTKDALVSLSNKPTKEWEDKLNNAREALKKRQEIAKDSSLMSPSDLKLAQVSLTRAQITQYAAHPRLDLFVDGGSPHPGEKFGCTICHGGQGSSTDFYNASHTPSTSAQTDRWKERPSKKNDYGGHEWMPNHYWDFPMLPNRFVESSCVKCHYNMTDLIRDGSRVEAPKLMRGYNLVKDFGCFGCHEISGIKGGRWVGPGLRLEPSPPLDAYTPAERTKLTSDPLNPPGTQRKVGPSLRRLSEKTNVEWMVKWLREPRNFRPDTKMPHFYGLSNNVSEVLPSDQKDFPDAEIQAVAHFLMTESSNYLRGSDKFRLANEAKKKELEEVKKSGLISEGQQRELEEIDRRLERQGKPIPLAELMKDLPEQPKEDAARLELVRHGRELFSEKGCLACHMNEATHQPLKTPGKPDVPAVFNENQFGPNLSRIAAKLGTKPGDETSARRWLVQWIMNPNIHFPRTRMPITHLSKDEANAIATWLLSQKVKPEEWTGPVVPAPELDTLKNLAKVFLSRAFTSREVKKILDEGVTAEELNRMQKPLDADERELETTTGESKSIDNKLKMYIGKKAIGQLGCYACHDIPGFENAKPTGTPLNDWGKKDPERLAFEDVSAFVAKNYDIVNRLGDAKGEPVVTKSGKPLYEKFFADLLDHHQREGFLHQKLMEPRSYDFERLRAWDDRLRMPQFRFARSEPKKDEDPKVFAARQQKDEAEAREAVMTFILGLVAEPIPPKYVHQPDPQRLSEAVGRQVLDKFNCAGCHLVRSGVYEFKSNDETIKGLEANYNTVKTTFPSDHFFADSNAWNGIPSSRPDRFKVFGLRKEMPAVEENQPPDQLIFLTEALRFAVPDDKGMPKSYDIPAAGTVVLPKKQYMLSSADPFGGTFGNVLVDYLMQKDKQRYGTDDKARPAVPPALVREGEKTQPDWLFRFLREPFLIRPVTTLRMPKFNMSDEDAMALVNYFSAVDKVGNPAAGLSYPYFSIPERDDTYIAKQTAQYVERLKKAKTPNKQTTAYEERLEEMKPVWEDQLKRQLFDGQLLLQDAESALKKAEGAKLKPEDLKKLQDARDALKKDVEKAQAQADKKDIEPLRRRWEEKEAYLIDGFRVLASLDVCRNCHQVGNLPPKEAQGPSLALTFPRLRPDWTKRWLANPQRFMTYPTPMPQNFARNATQFQELFHGSSIEQATAARDALMNYPQVIELPANWQRPVVTAGTGGK